jgi:hypothetical protein
VAGVEAFDVPVDAHVERSGDVHLVEPETAVFQKHAHRFPIVRVRHDGGDQHPSTLLCASSAAGTAIPARLVLRSALDRVSSGQNFRRTSSPSSTSAGRPATSRRSRACRTSVDFPELGRPVSRTTAPSYDGIAALGQVQPLLQALLSADHLEHVVAGGESQLFVGEFQRQDASSADAVTSCSTAAHREEGEEISNCDNSIVMCPASSGLRI